MPSPFPGMDPYLEAHWGDVHTSLTTYARNQLKPQLPPDLAARVEEFVVLESFDDERPRKIVPDVRVVEAPPLPVDLPRPPTSVIAAAEPLVIPIQTEWTERAIYIKERKTGRLVTSIEFLSPGNKLSPHQRAKFQEKQESLLMAGANLVEIDLVRRGRWALTFPPDHVPDTHTYPYRICVIRAHRPHLAEWYAAPLQQPLPAIRVPLRPADSDVILNLQPLVAAAWEDGDYIRLDYASAPIPQFRPDDELWIQERIAAYLQPGDANP